MTNFISIVNLALSKNHNNHISKSLYPNGIFRQRLIGDEKKDKEYENDDDIFEKLENRIRERNIPVIIKRISKKEFEKRLKKKINISRRLSRISRVIFGIK